MIDITSYLNEAFLKGRFFDKENWLLSINKYVTNKKYQFLWDEEEDLWIEIGDDTNRIAMIARAFPFMFVIDQKILSEYSSCYSGDFVGLVISSWDLPEYRIYLNSLNSNIVDWRTKVVDPERFSINDFFYATH